MFVVVIKVFIL